MRLLCGFALELVLAFVRHCGRLLALAHSLVLAPLLVLGLLLLLGLGLLLLLGLDEQRVLLPRHTILTDARLLFLALLLVLCLTILLWSGTAATAAIALDLAKLGVLGFFPLLGQVPPPLGRVVQGLEVTGNRIHILIHILSLRLWPIAWAVHLLTRRAPRANVAAFFRR